MNIQLSPFWRRVGAYTMQRLGEPTTWAGIISFATAVLGFAVPPEKQASIVAAGTTVFSILLMAAREGRSVPQNPSLPATVKGVMPPAPPAIVPPNTTDMQTIAPSDKLEADPAGVVHVDGK